MRPLLSCSLLLACALAVGCDPKASQPTPPPPPQVSLAVSDSVVVAKTLTVTTSVSGCSSVTSLELRNGGALVRPITYEGKATVSEIPPGEISFSSGLAGDLLLTARATCDDGRVGESLAVPVRFLPVAEVIEGANGEYAVPELFIAEGEGQNVTFVGCVGVEGSTPTLARKDRTGRLLRTISNAPFPCSLDSVITDRNPVSGKRWLLEPDVGAYAFDSTMKVTAFRLGKFRAIGVGPDGDALLWDRDAMFEALVRVRHSDGGNAWTTGVQPYSLLTGNPIVKDGFVLLPIWISQIGSTQGTVGLELITYDNPNPERKGRYELMTISFGYLDAPAIPPTAFSPNGSILYVPQQPTPTTSMVSACSTAAQPCSGANQQWVSPVLGGGVQLVHPFAGGTRVAALAPRGTWFLDGLTGQPLNGQAVSPSGALVANSVLEGKGFADAMHPGASCGASACEDYYVFNGAARTPSTGPQLPLEVTAFDSASKGPVFRLEIPAGSLTGAIDDGGALWLRVGTKLIRPLPLSEYRKLRGL